MGIIYRQSANITNNLQNNLHQKQKNAPKDKLVNKLIGGD